MVGEDEAAWLEKAAESLQPEGRSRRISALRIYMLANLDAIMQVKERRQLSWPQMAELLSQRGLTKANGAPLDGNIVAVTAAAVRWARDARSRKQRPSISAKRARKAKAKEPASDASEAPPSPPKPPAPPPNALPVLEEEDQAEGQPSTRPLFRPTSIKGTKS